LLVVGFVMMIFVKEEQAIKLNIQS